MGTAEAQQKRGPAGFKYLTLGYGDLRQAATRILAEVGPKYCMGANLDLPLVRSPHGAGQPGAWGRCQGLLPL